METRHYDSRLSPSFSDSTNTTPRTPPSFSPGKQKNLPDPRTAGKSGTKPSRPSQNGWRQRTGNCRSTRTRYAPSARISSKTNSAPAQHQSGPTRKHRTRRFVYVDARSNGVVVPEPISGRVSRWETNTGVGKLHGGGRTILKICNDPTTLSTPYPNVSGPSLAPRAASPARQPHPRGPAPSATYWV